MMTSRLMIALEHLEENDILTRAETRIIYHSVENQVGGNVKLDEKEVLELVKFRKEGTK